MNKEVGFSGIALPSGSPWEWGELTPDQVLNLAALSDGGPEAPLFQYAAVRRCLALRDGVAAGDGFDILACVRACGTHGLVMPEWLARAFNSKYDPVLSGRAISWDDPLSFGRPYPKGARKNAIAKDRSNRVLVHLAICRAVEAGRSVNEELFDEVAMSIGGNATDVKRLYREAKTVLGLRDPLQSKGDGLAMLEAEMSAAIEAGRLDVQLDGDLSLAIPGSALSRRKFSKTSAVKKKP